MPRLPRSLLALSLFGLLPSAAARADLDCAAATVQLGEVRSGVPLSHRFTLVNHGPDAVLVTDVRPSCGCLAPKLDRRSFQPGESGTLLLEVNTLTQPAGLNTWRTTVTYQSGGTDHELALYLCARVVTEITVEPPALAVYTDAAIGHEITVIDRRTEPLLIRSVQASSPYVRTRLGEMRRDGEGRWARPIQVEVLADCPEGRHEESLYIHTSDPTYPELKVPFTVVKRARRQVSATPSAVVLSQSGGGPLPARIVLLGTADEQEVRVEKVEADDPAITCQWAAGPGPRATLKIRIDRARISGDTLNSTVHVRLSRPAPQTLTIPVSCSLR
jgi:hypothetical protein